VELCCEDIASEIVFLQMKSPGRASSPLETGKWKIIELVVVLIDQKTIWN
jgi:hypothetical protein